MAVVCPNCVLERPCLPVLFGSNPEPKYPQRFDKHNQNHDQSSRPWGKPERIYYAAREAMQLRHALIPYIYSMAWRAHQTGLSLITPMYYGNMDSADAFAAKDQYFFGTELMAAPVLKAINARSGLAAQKVWFPAGSWFNFFDGVALDGDRWHTIKSTLEDIPVFAKAGAIVPLAPKVKWGGLDNPRELDVYVFPGAHDIANFGIPMILYEPLASFIGWMVLMILISPFLQLLTTISGSYLALMRWVDHGATTQQKEC